MNIFKFILAFVFGYFMADIFTHNVFAYPTNSLAVVCGALFLRMVILEFD